ncbi:hypothetical protein [Zavarzinella formosa]|uniref:hypothetical protein n=1 Tax=Zavarzinella formosa TaxID=360055 RepID=UPI0002E1D0E5|nr:hypothetical protein [Zavarzinella formosa]
MTRLFLVAVVFALPFARLFADDVPKADPRYPFRTDSANPNRPWFQPKPGEFPPAGSAHRIDGELVTADFVHRTGQFRTADTGELKDFILPPYGAIRHLNTDADLRDVPLGTFGRFFLHPDSQGNFTRLAVWKDQFTADTADGITYRLDEAKPGEGKLFATRHAASDLGKTTLMVSDTTRVWKGGKRAKLADLVIGDELLVNRTGVTKTDPGHCTDVWAGVDTHKLVTEKQRQTHAVFLKARGLAGWVDRTEGRTLTITLFGGDRAEFEKMWLKDFAIGRDPHVVVTNDELRTWNPPVDHERGKIIEVQRDTEDGYGRGGVRLRVTVNFMLEGFRRRRVLRVFAGGWPLKDQPFGEQLFHYGARSLPTELMELPPKEYPGQFPFRTDYGNENFPWYRLKAGVAPPVYAEHQVFGELVSVDVARRTGQFRADRSDTMVEFSLIPEGKTRYLNAECDLSAIPVGTRCRFSMYQDAAGAFTQACLVTDESTHLIANGALWRVESLLDSGKIYAARQPPGVKNDQGDPEQPPDIGRAELRFNPETRFWKGDRQVTAGDLAVGDLLLVNVTGERPGHPSRCTDVWIGADTHKMVIERQARKTMPKR